MAQRCKPRRVQSLQRGAILALRHACVRGMGAHTAAAEVPPIRQIVEWIETMYEDGDSKHYSCKYGGRNSLLGQFFWSDTEINDDYSVRGFPNFETLKQNITLLDSIICAAAPQGLSRAAKRRLFENFQRDMYKDKDAAAIVASLLDSSS